MVYILECLVSHKNVVLIEKCLTNPSRKCFPFKQQIITMREDNLVQGRTNWDKILCIQCQQRYYLIISHNSHEGHYTGLKLSRKRYAPAKLKFLGLVIQINFSIYTTFTMLDLILFQKKIWFKFVIPNSRKLLASFIVCKQRKYNNTAA